MTVRTKCQPSRSTLNHIVYLNRLYTIIERVSNISANMPSFPIAPQQVIEKTKSRLIEMEEKKWLNCINRVIWRSRCAARRRTEYEPVSAPLLNLSGPNCVINASAVKGVPIYVYAVN